MRVGSSVAIASREANAAPGWSSPVTTPARRIRTIERLAKAGIRVGVMVAPIIPGLNDEDMGDVLRAARDAGATHAEIGSPPPMALPMQRMSGIVVAPGRWGSLPQ